MASFSITSNHEEFLKNINKKKLGVQTEVKKEVGKEAKKIRTTLYSMTPRGPSFSNVGARATVEGGAARAAFTVGGKGSIFIVTDCEATIGSMVEHMKYLEEGTRAHGPVTAKFLHFFTTKGEVFTKWVKGIKPHRIFKRTQLLYSRIWPKDLKAAVGRGLKK